MRGKGKGQGRAKNVSLVALVETDVALVFVGTAAVLRNHYWKSLVRGDSWRSFSPRGTHRFNPPAVGWKADEGAVLKLPGPPQVCAVRGYCVRLPCLFEVVYFLKIYIYIYFFFFFSIVFDLIASFQWLIV